MAKATARVKPASPVRPGPPAKPAAPAADRWGTLNNFVDHGLQELAKETRSPSAGLVWFVLFRLAYAPTRLVRGASIRRLAKLAHLDRVTVRRAMHELLKRGHVKVHDRAGNVPVYYLEHVSAEDEPGE